MDIKVMKFGGTSLKNEKTRAYVYRHIVKNLISKMNMLVCFRLVISFRHFSYLLIFWFCVFVPVHFLFFKPAFLLMIIMNMPVC